MSDRAYSEITQIVQGKHGVMGGTALRLGHWFGMNPQFWLNLQPAYDLKVAREAGGSEIEALLSRAGFQREPS